MYIATVPNRKSPPAILLRESYRQQEGGGRIAIGHDIDIHGYIYSRHDAA